MATGFRSYMDTPGSPILADMTVKFSQNIGYVDTGAVNGSATVPDAPNGRQFFYYVVGTAANSNGDGRKPGVLLTDNGDTVTITWTYSYNPGFGRYNLACRIHYGYI